MKPTKVAHIDDEYLATGTHKGADGGLVLRNKGADFKSCGITAGVAIQNDTDSSAGLVTAVTENTVTCTLTGGTNNTWTNGDTYYIFKTAAEDTFISFTYTDRRFGRKVVKGDILNQKGFFLEDEDLDQDVDEVFGPNQPEHSHE
jgi:hypothetical protein